MRNGRPRRSAQIDTQHSIELLEDLAEEGCAECFSGNCGARRPCCCELIEHLSVDDRGRYSCGRCKFLGSPRQLRAKLILEGRIS